MRAKWSGKIRPRLFRNVSGTDVFLWLIGGSILLALIYGSIGTLAAGEYSGENWLRLIVFGLALGAVYALVALGHTLICSVMLMVNLAHGEIFMAGAFTAFFVADTFDSAGYFNEPGFNPRDLFALGVIVLISAVTSAVVAVILERVAYRPLRGAPRLATLITAIGASLFLQSTFRGFYGAGPKTYPDVEMLKGQWSLLGVGILKLLVVVIVVAVLMMAGLYWFVRCTKTGKTLRSVAEDRDTAAVTGIDVDRAIVITFAIAGALAGAAGVLYAFLFKQVDSFVGFVPGLKAFTAAALGGIGNIPGAMLGGFFLGVAESLGPSLFLEGLGIPGVAQLRDVIPFAILVLVLIFRPSGLLDEPSAGKRS